MSQVGRDLSSLFIADLEQGSSQDGELMCYTVVEILGVNVYGALLKCADRLRTGPSATTL